MTAKPDFDAFMVALPNPQRRIALGIPLTQDRAVALIGPDDRPARRYYESWTPSAVKPPREKGPRPSARARRLFWSRLIMVITLAPVALAALVVIGWAIASAFIPELQPFRPAEPTPMWEVPPLTGN